MSKFVAGRRHNTDPPGITPSGKFVAKSIPAEVDEERVSERFHEQLQVGTDELYPDGVDLSSLDVHELTNELINKYTRNNDVGIILSWFRKKRLTIQTEAMQALNLLVTQIRENSKNLEQFKSELMAKQRVMTLLIHGLILQAQQELELMKERHKTSILQEELDRERAKQEILTIQLENSMLAAKVTQEEGKADILRLRGQLIKKFIDQLDIPEINMKHVFVLIEMIKDASSQRDFTTIDEQIAKLKAEAFKAQADADVRNQEARAARVSTGCNSRKLVRLCNHLLPRDPICPIVVPPAICSDDPQSQHRIDRVRMPAGP